MKSRKLFLVTFLAVFLSIVAACSHGGSEVVGHWKSPHATLNITKEGDQFFVKINNPSGLMDGTFAGPYKNGQIALGGIVGNLTYLKSQDKILLAGEEFSRSK